MDANIITDFIDKKLAQASGPPSYSNTGEKDFTKGLIAGMAGGLAATAAKSLAEKVYPPRTHGEPNPPEVLADRISDQFAGHELAATPKAIAAESIHWTFGLAAGAAYGVLAEFYPAATGREGASFGMTLMALTHEGALPALGLSAHPEEQTAREKSSEMVTHVVFGLVTEVVRRFVRSRL